MRTVPNTCYGVERINDSNRVLVINREVTLTDDISPEARVYTQTQYATIFTETNPLQMACGQTLTEVTVAYETYGELNQNRDNAIYLCHALTGDAHACGWHEGDKHPGWWDTMVGPGKAIDTNQWFVVCSNLLGGCQGTTGPSSTNPATGKPYGLSFPLLTMADFVAVHRGLARHLGIDHFHALVGGSMGGMQVLEWALNYPDEMTNAVVVASSSRLTAQNIAFSAVGRAAIVRDENFFAGDFAAHDVNPDVGLSVARMMAHITYTSEVGFEQKFGRRPQREHRDPGFGVDFAIESYLHHQGQSFLSRFDALSYLYLTRVMDYFDPFADPDALTKLINDPVNFLVMSFDSDWRFSTDHSRRIVRTLEQAHIPVSFREISAPWGHDSFLLDVEPYLATVKAFLTSPANLTKPAPEAHDA